MGRNVGNFFGRFSRASMALVCAGFSTFVLVLCLFAGTHFKRAAEQELYRETENTAHILMTAFEDDAANVDAILTRIAAQIPEQDVSVAREPELYRLLTRYALHPSMLGPAIIDRDGTLIASTRTDNVPKISMKERQTFLIHAEHPNESRLYISAPMRGLLSNEWSIQFSRPLRDETGTFYGVVLASYRLSHFVELYEKIKLSDHGLAGLTGKDGIVRHLLRSRRPRRYYPHRQFRGVENDAVLRQRRLRHRFPSRALYRVFLRARTVLVRADGGDDRDGRLRAQARTYRPAEPARGDQCNNRRAAKDFGRHA
jgi:hypothetical protein